MKANSIDIIIRYISISAIVYVYIYMLEDDVIDITLDLLMNIPEPIWIIALPLVTIISGTILYSIFRLFPYRVILCIADNWKYIQNIRNNMFNTKHNYRTYINELYNNDNISIYKASNRAETIFGLYMEDIKSGESTSAAGIYLILMSCFYAIIFMIISIPIELETTVIFMLIIILSSTIGLRASLIYEYYELCYLLKYLSKNGNKKKLDDFIEMLSNIEEWKSKEERKRRKVQVAHISTGTTNQEMSQNRAQNYQNNENTQ